MSLSSSPAPVNYTSTARPPLFPDDTGICDDFRKLPNTLTRHYRALGVSHAQMCMVHTIRSYARPHQHPTPSLSTVALDMETDIRQVQRWVKDLCAAGLLVVHERAGADGRQLANAYDFTPLLRRCEEIAAAKAAAVVGDAPGSSQEDTDQAAQVAAPLVELPTPPPVKNTTPIEMGTYVPREYERKNDPPTPKKVVKAPPRPRPQGRLSAQEQALATPLEQIAAEFGDRSPILATVRQAEDMRQAAGLEISAFLSRIAEARLHMRGALDARRRRSTLAPISNPMGYYLTILAQLLCCDDAPPPRRERQRRRQHQDTQAAPPPSLPEPATVWDAITAEAIATMTPENVTRWFVPARQVEYGAGMLIVAVPDDFHQQWLDRRLRASIERCAARVQPGLQIAFVVQPALPPLDQVL